MGLASATRSRSLEEPGTRSAFEGWELHSELVLVCPELRAHSLELLAVGSVEQEEQALASARAMAVPGGEPRRARDPGLTSALVRYALLQAARMAGTGLGLLVLAVAIGLVAHAVAH